MKDNNDIKNNDNIKVEEVEVKENKSNRGAKCKYETHVLPNLEIIEGWVRNGATDKQICENLNISIDSYYRYKNKYTEFSEVLKRSKDVADITVENALYKRALGYKYDEVTYEGGVETKRVTKQMAGDTTAQIFWLKNRKPREWRDKRHIESENNVSIKNPFEEIDTEDIKKLLEEEVDKEEANNEDE